MPETQVKPESGSGDGFDGLLKAIKGMARATAQMVVATVAMDMLETVSYTIAIDRELEEMLGEEFMKACREDDDCRKTIWDIAVTSRWWETEGEEYEKRQRHEKVLKLLVEKLKEMKIELWCEEKDLGELGTMYENCYVEFAGERFTVEEVHDAMTGIHVPWFNPFPEEGGDGDQEG